MTCTSPTASARWPTARSSATTSATPSTPGPAPASSSTPAPATSTAFEQIEGFNAFVRGWDPSFMKNMVMYSINRPIRIGPVTVLPGDVILARQEGVIVIPPQLAEEVVVSSEVVAAQRRVRPPAAPRRDVHPRADRRALDGRDQGRLLPLAGVAARPARDPARRDREAPLTDGRPPGADGRAADDRVGRGYVPARIARRRSPTIASSPGSIIQTPMTSCRREPGLTSMLGSPSRSFSPPATGSGRVLW